MTEIDPDSIVAVARKDFRDAIRSRGLLLLTAVFVVFFAVAAYVSAEALQQQLQQAANSGNASQAQRARQIQQNLNSDAFLKNLTQVTRLLIPLTGIVVAYASVVGERESGTLKLLLSLPHSRLDVLLGKLGGRSAVVGLPVLLGFLVAAPIFPLLDVPFEAVHFAVFALLTAFVGVVFVAISVGTSAAAPTNRWAMIPVVILYAFFTLLWGRVAKFSVGKIADWTDLADQTLLKLLVTARHLNPIAAYESLTLSLYQPDLSARVGLITSNPLGRRAYMQMLGDVPIYLTDGALVIYLLLWIVVPIALGYWVFEQADL